LAQYRSGGIPAGGPSDHAGYRPDIPVAGRPRYRLHLHSYLFIALAGWGVLSLYAVGPIGPLLLSARSVARLLLALYGLAAWLVCYRLSSGAWNLPTIGRQMLSGIYSRYNWRQLYWPGWLSAK